MDLQHPESPYIDPPNYKDSFQIDLAIICLIFLVLLFWFVDRYIYLMLIAFFLPAEAGPRIKSHEIEKLMPPFMVQISSSDGGGGSKCVICLGEFRDREWCRVFPECSHEFHVPCIDAWLKHRNLTCSLCRNSLEDAISADVTGDDLV